MRRTASILGTALAVAVIVAGAALGAKSTKTTTTGPPFGGGSGGGGANPGDPGQGSCDVDGLQVGWSTDFAGTPGSYAVTTADISGIAPTCAGADLSVLLFAEDSATTPLAAATVPVPSSTNQVSVPFTVDPRAEDISRVSVVLDGGQLPIPTECRALKLQKVLIGTVGDDNGQPGANPILWGSPFNDIIYGIAGDNVIRGIEGSDCLIAGRGNDIVNGDAGADVIIVEFGDNTVYGGPGNDTIYVKGNGDRIFAQPGKNLVDIRGNNNIVDGGGGSSRCINRGTGNTIKNCKVTRS